MKIINKISQVFIIIVLIFACKEEQDNFDYLDAIVPPANVAVAYNITQDNSGLVTLIPTAEGVSSFVIDFGDGSETKEVIPGSKISHIYTEGTYTVKVIASNISGDSTELSQELVVSFKAPENLMVTLENDAAKSKQLNITATADFASMFEFYSGEAGVDQPVATANIGETINYQYTDAGTYSVKVVAKGGAIQTTEYTTDFEVTAILAPLASAPNPSSRNEADVISIFSDAYTDIAGSDFYPNWGQNTIYTDFDLNGDKIIQYSNLNYQGIDIGAEIDASSMETLHIDIWTADATSIDIYPLPNGVQPADERFVTKTLVANQWNSFEIPMTDFTGQNLPVDKLKQFKFVGSGSVFIDNLYFYKAPSVAVQALIHDDFEGNGNITTWAGDAAGLNTSLANPFKTGINTSATVLEYDDTGGQYANVRFDASSKFNMATDNTFKLKIYVPSSSISGSQPNQISLKLQDGTHAEPWTTQTEIVKPITLDVWQEITFDFVNDTFINWSTITTDPKDRTDLDRVVIQINSENNNDTVKAYIDDFSYGVATTVPTGQIVSDDFEGNGNITTWAGDGAGMNASFANPHKTGINTSDTVLEYDDTGGQYANVRFDIAPDVFDMNAKSKMTLKIYVESSSISGSQPNQISLKFQDGTHAEPWTTQTEVIKSVVLDQWQEITFDFVNDSFINWSTITTDPKDRTDLSRVVIQINSENNTDTVKAYIDDINYHN